MSAAAASRRQRHWDLRAAGNFIGGGTGTGLIVMAALAAVAGAPFRLVLAIGLAAVLGGLSLVWLEIGRPWRALNVFFHPRTSWMTREGILATVLVPVALFAAGMGSAVAAVGAALLACGFLYCQARILRAARGIPAWRQAEIVPLILATGIAEGSGLYLLAGGHAAPWLMFALLAALLREVAWRAYRAGVAATPAGARSVEVFDAPSGQLAYAGQLAGAALVAVALLAGPLGGTAGLLAWAGGALMALSGWGFKAVLITRAAFIRAAVVPMVPTRGGR